MIRLLRIAPAAALLALALSGCGVTGWVAEQLGTDDAVALKRMETELASLWSEREARRRANLGDPVVHPLVLEDLETQFYDLSVRAEQKADGRDRDARFRARYYHLAARAAIGAAGRNMREDQVDGLVQKGSEICAGALKNDLRAHSSICLTMGLLAPVAMVSKIARLEGEWQAQPAAERNIPEVDRWPGLLLKQYQAFERPASPGSDDNPSLVEYRKEARKSVVCVLRGVAKLYAPGDDDKRRSVAENVAELEAKTGAVDCFKLARERAGLAP